jgi:hypothetical protein
MDSFRRFYDRRLEVIAGSVVGGVKVFGIMGVTNRWAGY